MKKLCVTLSLLLMTLLVGSGLDAQGVDKCPVKLSQSTTVRSGTISITVANPPMQAQEGTVRLIGADTLTSKPIPVKNGTLEYTLPPNLPLGRYSLTVNLGNHLFSACEFLRVAPAPNWELKLLQFEPNATYEFEMVRVPDSKSPQQGKELKTSRLTLRGSGFLVDTPDDNQIIINGELQQVKWGDVKNLPDARKPVPNEIHGKVISPERIDLVRVPVPADGAMKVMVQQGDKVTDVRQFTVYRASRWPVAIVSAVIAGILGLLVLLLVYAFSRHTPKEEGHNFLKVLFLDLETNTYSLSKLQFYCWTATALFGYAYLVISKMVVQGAPWPDIPGGLPGIVAIGAGTSVGAQFVTNIRGPKGAGVENPSLGDFVTSGGVAAPERVQILVWTLFGAAAFCLAVLQHEPGTIQEIDPVPSGMLYMMGLSAAGYLGGKMARKPGPVINEISITPPEPDEALAKAAAPSPDGPPNLSQPAAKAQGVAQTLTPVPPGADKAVKALTDGIAAASLAKTVADAEAAVTTLANLRVQAEAAAKTAAEAFAQTGTTPESARAAEMAEQATAALQDLATEVSSLVSTSLAPVTPGTVAGPKFTRIIELRGRNLSADAKFEIDGVELPFRMLCKKSDEPQRPEVVIWEQEDPTLARTLRLSIDPGQLEAPDFQRYWNWFGAPKSETRRFTVTNLDGQKSDVSFALPDGKKKDPGPVPKQ